MHCEACEHGEIAYNSCRNRHCPRCQASAAKRWLDARQAELLPVDYYHVVFTLPAPISAIAYYNKAVIYRLLFEVASETLITIAADPKASGRADRHRQLTTGLDGRTRCHVPMEGYRDKGATRHKTMTLEPEEFMRRFLLHVLPSGFHRIRHYGLIANNGRKENLSHAKELLHVAPAAGADAKTSDKPTEPVRATFVCSHCGAPMIIVQTFARGQAIRAPPHVAGEP